MQLQLIRTKQITYTTPPTPEEASAIAEIDAIDRKKKPDAEDQARRQELTAVKYAATQYRFTISTCRALDHARFLAARRQWPRWLTETTGAKFDDAIETDHGLQLAIMGDRWARMLASVTALESREIDRLAADDAGAAWTPEEIPQTWKDTPAAYIDEAPADLVEAIDQAALALNPGLFVVETSDESKKKGGVSAK